MDNINWADKVMDFFIGLLILIIGAIPVLAIFKKTKIWLSNIYKKILDFLKQIYVNWHFFIPLLIVVIITIIINSTYKDFALTIIIVIAYTMGLAGWWLSNKKKTRKNDEESGSDSTTYFQPIQITPSLGNSYLKERYIDPPLGSFSVGGVQFDLGQNPLVFDTHKHIRSYHPLKDDGKQIDFQLPNPVNNIKSIHFLINSGNSQTIFRNICMGQIKLVFKDAPPIDEPLCLGQNIREWCLGNSGNYIREISDKQKIIGTWRGMSKDGVNAIIDCLEIPIFPIMRNAYLEKIIFTHVPTSGGNQGVHYTVFGISIERVTVP